MPIYAFWWFSYIFFNSGKIVTDSYLTTTLSTYYDKLTLVWSSKHIIVQSNLYNETREDLLKTQRFCNLSVTVFTKSCLFSLSWKTTYLERPSNLKSFYTGFNVFARIDQGWFRRTDARLGQNQSDKRNRVSVKGFGIFPCFLLPVSLYICLWWQCHAWSVLPESK